LTIEHNELVCPRGHKVLPAIYVFKSLKTIRAFGLQSSDREQLHPASPVPDVLDKLH
jgi:hypothetical protein